MIIVRVSCDYDTVVGGSDSTVMLKTVELSLFYPTVENLTPVFKRVILFRLTEANQSLLLAVAFSCQSTLHFCAYNNLFIWNSERVV